VITKDYKRLAEVDLPLAGVDAKTKPMMAGHDSAPYDSKSPTTLSGDLGRMPSQVCPKSVPSDC
jgi:hypothetical protein